MGRSLNKVMLIGNLGNDPEVKYTQSGKANAYLSLATNESWQDKDGNKQERTEWHKLKAWGKLAEICGEYLTKGRTVYVEGMLRTDKWDDRDGNKRTSTAIVIDQMIMMPGKSNAADSSPPPDQPEDDIPF